MIKEAGAALIALLGATGIMASPGTAATADDAQQGTVAPVEELSRQYQHFKRAAEEAERVASEKESEAAITASFIRDSRSRLEQSSPENRSELESALMMLQARHAREQAEALEARERAQSLTLKAGHAEKLVRHLSAPNSVPSTVAGGLPARAAPGEIAGRGRDSAPLFGLRPSDLIPRKDSENLIPRKDNEDPVPRKDNEEAPEPLLEPFLKRSRPSANDEVRIAQIIAGLAATRVSGDVGLLLLDRPIDRRVTGASISLSQKGSSLVLQKAFHKSNVIDYTWQSEQSRGKERETFGRGGYSRSLVFGVSAQSKDGFGALYGDGELTGGVRLTVDLNRAFFKPRTDFPDDTVRAPLRETVSIEEDLRKAEKELQKLCYEQARSESPGASHERLSETCAPGNLVAWATALNDKGVLKNKKALTLLSRALVGTNREDFDQGIGFEIGYQKLSFRNLLDADPSGEDPNDALGLRVRTPDRISWSLNAHTGKFFYANLTDGALEPFLYVAALAELGQEFVYRRGTQEQITCPPGPRAPRVRSVCVTTNIEPPIRDYFARLGLQARFKLPQSWWTPGVGVAPKVTYDFQEQVFAYDVPIAFVANKENQLTAGLRFKGAFGDKRDPFAIGLFLGSAFGVTGGP